MHPSRMVPYKKPYFPGFQTGYSRGLPVSCLIGLISTLSTIPHILVFGNITLSLFSISPFSLKWEKCSKFKSHFRFPSVLSPTRMSTQVQPQPAQPEPSKCTPPAQQTSNSLNETPTIHDTLAFQEPETPQTKWLYFKVLSAGFSFFVAGVNDGSLGSVIPYVMISYKINTDMVSILYVKDPASSKFNIFLLTRPGTPARFSDGWSLPFLTVLLPSTLIWV